MSVKPSQSHSRICTVIVTYNGAPWIVQAVASLLASEEPCTCVVVDNASQDDTVELVRSQFPQVVLLAQTANLGFGRGNNVGIAWALAHGAELVFLLNQDAYVTPDALGRLSAFMSQHTTYGVVTPLHCSPDLKRVDPNTQRAYLQPYVPQYLSDACVGEVRDHYPIHGINAAAWMVRSEVWKTAGGFDPLFFMYGEDDDLINRFAYHGIQTALLPMARIVHLRAKSKPRAVLRGLARLHAASERELSRFLVDAKDPRSRPVGALSRLLVNGFLQPILNGLRSHQREQVLIDWWAAVRTLARWRAIRRSAVRCRAAGPHYLQEALDPRAR